MPEIKKINSGCLNGDDHILVQKPTGELYPGMVDPDSEGIFVCAVCEELAGTIGVSQMNQMTDKNQR